MNGAKICETKVTEKKIGEPPAHGFQDIYDKPLGGGHISIRRVKVKISGSPSPTAPLFLKQNSFPKNEPHGNSEANARKFWFDLKNYREILKTGIVRTPFLTG